MALYDLLAQGEADTSPLVLLSGVQSLEQHEELVLVHRVDAYAVILDGKEPLLALVLGGDVNSGHILSMKLDGVVDEVLEHLRDLDIVG